MNLMQHLILDIQALIHEAVKDYSRRSLMLDTMTYVFMVWVAAMTNLNSSDTGCPDYETVIECLTCDKKKRTVYST